MYPQNQQPQGQGQWQAEAQGGHAYGQYGTTAADASVDDRAAFLVRTYAHLLGAIFSFVVLEALLFVSGAAAPIARVTLMGGQIGWLVVLGAFMGVSWMAQKLSRSQVSKPMQYAGLALYVVAEAVIFVPLITIVMMIASETGGTGMDILGEAGILTVVLFGGLTAIVLVTRKNFSFLRSAILFGGLAIMGLIAMAAFTGFTLGPIFMWGMVVFAALSILYNTSRVLHDYRTDQYVAAALELFASFALLLWYVIQIVASRR